MSHHVEQFELAITRAGLEAPVTINPDGAIHRFSTNGKRGDDSGWYMLHTDGIPAGAFGCWCEKLTQSWCAKSDNAMTDAEREAHRLRIKTMKAQREAELLVTQQKARQTAAALWQRANPATAHPYLTAKGIQPYGIEVLADKLMIPMRDTAGTNCAITALDAIPPNLDAVVSWLDRVTGVQS